MELVRTSPAQNNASPTQNDEDGESEAAKL